jgi:hypothetical protein
MSKKLTKNDLAAPLPSCAFPAHLIPHAPGPDVVYCAMCIVPLANYKSDLPRRCSDCARLIQDWHDCSRWSDLLNLNREFIEGKRLSTPYSIYPVFENAGLHPGLLRLHDYGLLVTDAQAGMVKLGQEMSGEHMGRWYEVKERAYIRCAFPTNDTRISKAKIERLIALLWDKKEVEFVSYFEYSEYEYGGGQEGKYMAAPFGITQEHVENKEISTYKMFYSTVGPSSAGRTVAKHRWSTTREGLIQRKWRRCKHNQLPVINVEDIPKNSKGRRTFGQQLPMTLGMQPLIITLAVRNWPSTTVNLATLLEQACVQVGFEPIFEKQPVKGQTVGANTVGAKIFEPEMSGGQKRGRVRVDDESIDALINEIAKEQAEKDKAGWVQRMKPQLTGDQTVGGQVVRRHEVQGKKAGKQAETGQEPMVQNAATQEEEEDSTDIEDAEGKLEAQLTEKLRRLSLKDKAQN